jgi:hypothetical protein
MTKKLLFLTVTIVISVQLVAQVEKNRIYPALTIGKHIFDYNTNTIQPSVSIGLSEHSTMGVFFKYTRTASYPSDFFKGYSEATGGGITYSYYHYFNKRSKWGWYFNAELGTYRINVFDKTSGTTVLNNRYTERELRVTPGIFFSASPRVMFFANVGGLALTHNYNGLHLNHRDFLNQVNIGVRISLGGNRKVKKISIQ